MLTFLGTGNTWPSLHSSKSAWLLHNLLYNSRSQVIFLLLSAFNALGGTPFIPGDISFADFVVDFLMSSHEMGDQVLPSRLFY